MSKGFKIWLWILMIGGVISAIMGLATFSYSVGAGFLVMIMAIAQILGAYLLLFKQKREGFYVICAVAVINFLYNVTHYVSFFYALIGLVAMPGITYLFLNKREKENVEKNNTTFQTNNNTKWATNTTSNSEKKETYTAAATADSTTLSGSQIIVTPDKTTKEATTVGERTTAEMTEAAFATGSEKVETTETATEKTTAYNDATSNSATSHQSAEHNTTANQQTTNNTKTSRQHFKRNEKATENKSFEEAASMFGSAKKMDVSVDLYKELEIDRAWDEKSIRNHLKGLQKLWTQRQGATNDKEQLLLIDKILKMIEDGYRFLTKAVKRKQYDQALELAYKAGNIVDDVEEKLLTLLDQARAYYRKGNLKMATKCAEEAIEGKVNEASAYDLLARCYYDAEAYDKAIVIVDQGINIFNSDINLHWLGARIATIGTQDYDNAQQRINTLIALAPNNSIGHSEQVYLHLRKGDEQLAFQEIDSYIEKHPDDNTFKQGVSYDLISYSNTCYYYDAAQQASFIADKESYEKCLSLRKKAVEIYDDEHTRDRLENAKYYGQKEWNDWNMPAIKSLAIYGTIFGVLGFAVTDLLPFAFILFAIMGVLIYFSFRPYWQINKSYITGQMGTLERIVNKVGEATAKVAELTFQVIWKAVYWTVRFCLELISGRWF